MEKKENRIFLNIPSSTVFFISIKTLFGRFIFLCFFYLTGIGRTDISNQLFFSFNHNRKGNKCAQLRKENSYSETRIKRS